MTEVDLTIVVLAYNEREGLERAVLDLVSRLEPLGQAFELLIIDDGSTDGTGAVADALANGDRRIRVAHHGINRGLGAAYRTGFSEARGRFIGSFPADGQFDSEALPRFRAALEDADMVLGTIDGAGRLWVARMLSAAERLAYGALFGGFPSFQGLMMFRRELLSRLPLKSKDDRSWVVVMELILRAKRAGFRLVNRPTVLRPRASGGSKVTNLRTIWANLRSLLRLRLEF